MTRSTVLKAATAAVILFSVVAIRCWYLVDQHRKQRYTEADLRSLSIALDNYAGEHEGHFPEVEALLVVSSTPSPAQGFERRPPPAWPLRSEAIAARLHSALVPAYIRRLPEVDRWGQPILVGITTDRRHFTLLSRGRDGLLDPAHPHVFPPDEFDHDLIVSDGVFICFPDGDAP